MPLFQRTQDITCWATPHTDEAQLAFGVFNLRNPVELLLDVYLFYVGPLNRTGELRITLKATGKRLFARYYVEAAKRLKPNVSLVLQEQRQHLQS